MLSKINPRTESSSDLNLGELVRYVCAAILFIFMSKALIPIRTVAGDWDQGNLWLLGSMLVWQCVHMYIIGRKNISLDNFDGIDLVSGCFVLYFFWQSPLAYILSAGLIYLITNKRSIRA